MAQDRATLDRRDMSSAVGHVQHFEPIAQLFLAIAKAKSNSELDSARTARLLNKALRNVQFQPARALITWLTWIKTDYPRALLAAMVQAEWLIIPEREYPASHSGRLADLIGQLPISGGRAAYLAAIGDAISSQEDSLELLADREVANHGHLLQDLTDFQALRELVLDLLLVSPKPNASAGEFVAAAEGFLRQLVRCTNSMERSLAIRLARDLERAQYWPQEDPPAAAML